MNLLTDEDKYLDKKDFCGGLRFTCLIPNSLAGYNSLQTGMNCNCWLQTGPSLSFRQEGSGTLIRQLH